MRHAAVALAGIALVSAITHSQDSARTEASIEDGKSPSALIVPADANALPIFGIRGGIQVALPPAALDSRPDGGPRGLIRVGLELDGKLHLVNYIAIEPVVNGARGLSELERSGDGKQGKRLTLAEQGAGKLPWIVENTARGRSVRFVVDCEPFANGAHALIEVALFEKDPLAVRFRTLAAPDSAPMSALILTSTMGNQSRCRDLWLADRIVFSRELYADYRGDHFVERDAYPLDQLHRTRAGDVVVAITPDEFDPRECVPFANGAWRCTAPWLVQYWRKPRDGIDPALRCRVNGRRVYWAGTSPIPCGTSFENFELIEPFDEGSTFWFGFSFEDPRKTFDFKRSHPPHAPTTRRITTEEERVIRDATASRRALRNGDFANQFDGWNADKGAQSFQIFDRPADGSGTRTRAVTTFGPQRDADRGRLFQCFVVPDDATELRFFVHGGADPRGAAIRLWRGKTLWRWTSGRDDNVPFEVRWDLVPLRGSCVTLEIVDDSTSPWGFIGAHGFDVARTHAMPPLSARTSK